jgi:hypothetical protein
MGGSGFDSFRRHLSQMKSSVVEPIQIRPKESGALQWGHGPRGPKIGMLSPLSIRDLPLLWPLAAFRLRRSFRPFLLRLRFGPPHLHFHAGDESLAHLDPEAFQFPTTRSGLACGPSRSSVLFIALRLLGSTPVSRGWVSVGLPQLLRRKEASAIVANSPIGSCGQFGDNGKLNRTVRPVCRIFCATANSTEVVLAETDTGRGILGVIDGFSPKGIEDENDFKWRKDFLRQIGYKA